ncbi:hypothetical protein CL618_02815 [archaeon]|nr:hypothetical protein [archaeon]|tara:strand:+ start:361 stop:639 length:279 start_codon:yes stop_codon:yes gene_type:complete
MVVSEERRLELLVRASKEDVRKGRVYGRREVGSGSYDLDQTPFEPDVGSTLRHQDWGSLSYKLAILHNKWHGLNVRIPEGYKKPKKKDKRKS